MAIRFSMRAPLVLIAGLGLVAGGSIAAAPAAQATQTSTSCIGTLVSSEPFYYVSNQIFAWQNVYWDASTGENCAILQSGNMDWGVAKPMSIAVYTCATDTGPRFKGDDVCAQLAGTKVETDEGNYSYFAGPVSASGAGHCVEVEASVSYNGESFTNWQYGWC